MAFPNGASPVPDASIATSPNDLLSVPAILEQISAQGAYLSMAPQDYGSRLQLLASARALVQALETPRETMIKHIWAQPAVQVGITMMYEAGVFHVMAKKDGPITVKECAEATNMDPKLLARLMRHLGSMGYLIETGVDEYALTNFSRAMSLRIIGDGYPCIINGLFNTLSKFGEFTKAHDNKMVLSHTDTALRYAEKVDMDVFTWLRSMGLGAHLNNHMAGYHQGRPSWMDANVYPVEERLVKGADTSDDAPFLVDIGGSTGHDPAEFLAKHPCHPGKLILEDLPVVIDHIQQLDSRIERVHYDFHTEQPHKGARAYYMHSVLHDWPDDVCASILKNVLAAMKPGYSRLLVNECVIPDRGADWQATALDVMIMIEFSAKERTLADWTRLLEPAGLRIMNVWSGGDGAESLIECELA
ncbi:catechol O-methyltransferase [Apiospora hydei]|uniref:Catechol O-methyltransferase n=1 Tax=Apiospora hydei TaxID=1337664 RepID=A0ABR1WWN7_9PEZI